AHTTVAINCDRRHARAARMIEEPAQTIEGLLGSWIEDPSTRSYRPNAPLITFGEKRRCASGQVGDIIIHGSSIRILDKGYRFAGIDSAKRAPARLIHLGFRTTGLPAADRRRFFHRSVDEFTLRHDGPHD